MNCIDWSSKRSKTVRVTLNYKSDQNPMSCIDLTSKRSKCWVTSQNIQNKAKLQKWSNYNELHRFDVKTIKMLSYVQNIQNKAKLQKWSNYNELHRLDVQNDQNVEVYVAKHSKSNLNLHRFDVKTIKMLRLRRKTFKTKLNYKSDQNPMTCIDLTSKRSKCWVTSQNIQNKAKLQKWSNYNELHRLDVKTIKTVRVTSPNYKSDQNPMNCIDLTSKLSKCWGTSQNIQNKAKLQNWSKSNELHRFDVKTIKMLSYVAKHSKQS